KALAAQHASVALRWKVYVDTRRSRSVEQPPSLLLRLCRKHHDLRFRSRGPDLIAEIYFGRSWKAQTQKHQVESAARRRKQRTHIPRICQYCDPVPSQWNPRSELLQLPEQKTALAAE